MIISQRHISIGKSLKVKGVGFRVMDCQRTLDFASSDAVRSRVDAQRCPKSLSGESAHNPQATLGFQVVRLACLQFASGIAQKELFCGNLMLRREGAP
jgi:hypothetical protein